MFIFVLLCALILKPAASQFRPHLDLQKVAEVIYRNEKYNILKPTIHTVTDYFKDYILRRDSNLPTKRIFMDRNGFRHYWHGFEDENLRKANTKENVNKEIAKDDKNARTTIDAKTDAKVNSITTTKVRRTPRRMKGYEGPVKTMNLPDILRRNEERTVAKTTFFCPHFGVMTMTSFID